MTFGSVHRGLLLVLACLVSLAAQEASTNAPPPAAPVTSAAVLSIPTGEELVLELQDPINTRSTRKGAKISLTNTTDVLVNGRVVVPRGSTIHATVVESKRPGRLFGKAKVRLSFDEVELPDGTRIPLSAALSRAGWWGSKGAINQTVKGEGGKSHDIYTVGQGAAQGAIFGGIIAGETGCTAVAYGRHEVHSVPSDTLSRKILSILNMKYFISLKEFVVYDKRNYYQFFYHTDTCSDHRRREFSRLFC